MKRTVTIVKGKRRFTLFRMPTGSAIRHQQLGDGLTVLGDGDILVMPSRLHGTEMELHFAEGKAPNDVKVATAPKWLVDKVTSDAQLGGAQIRPAPIVATRDIRLEDIVFRDRLRAVRAENVASLAESLKTLGQTRAITVRPDPEHDDKFIGIAGDTLFEAAKSFDWTHIRADIMKCNEVDARLWEAMENLYRAKLTALEEAVHQAECVRLIAERETVSRQNVAKPKGGRPEDAIAKAARALPIKGKTQQARRKAIERGIKIAAMSFAAKVAATEAGLDDNRSALREIAKVQSPEGQLETVHEIAERQAKKQANRVNKRKAPKHDYLDLAESNGPSKGHRDDVIFAELKSECPRTFLRTWAEARTKVRRRFLRKILKWGGGGPLADKG
jgi:ParB-like chromosome segregation protein Spo0J